jgi:hypothetical protein
LGAFGVLMLASSPARALDLPKLFGKPLTTEITEVSIVAQRFDSREVDPITEGGAWGQWINRLNAKLDWNHFEVGMRLDSAVYWNTLTQQLMDSTGNCKNPTEPIPSAAVPPILCKNDQANIARDDLSRYQNSLYLAKVWGSYKQKGLEIIVGDAYVQFARGLVLSMRKLDDLGLDTTVRGFKAAVVRGPFAVTVVGGLANPARVDEASGQALFNEKSIPNTNPAFQNRGPQPIFGLDQIFGAEVQAGRDSPVVLTTSMSYVNRCAPNSYTGPNTVAPGRVTNPDVLSSWFGYCDDTSTSTWLGPLGSEATGFDRDARHVTTVAQSVEFPKMGKFGSLYVVGSIQQRDGYDAAQDPQDFDQGTALYAAYTGSYKKVDGTLEFKDYRNFYPTAASVNAQQVSALSNIAYSAVPTIESITQDNMLGNFNVCVDGLRARVDWRVNDALLVYGQGIFSISKGEQNQTCDRHGNLPSATASEVDYVADGLLGEQYEFEGKRSHLYATVGARQDSLGAAVGGATTFIQQFEVTYNFSKTIAKKVAIEFLGRHRVRYENGDNTGANGQAEYWVEGENYTGLSIAPKWIFTQGIEYTTRDLPANTTFAGITGYPAWLFLSVGGTYKFTKDSNIRVFVGQQRGGLKCISGVCRIFPAFEGARAELTLRF